MPPLVTSARAAVRRARTETLRRQLADCQLLAGFWCHGLSTRQLQSLRGSLPSTARLVVAKNTVLGKSIAGTPFEPIAASAKGMVAWLFVHTDQIREALAKCREFQKEHKLGLHDFTGGVFESRLYGPDDFGVLETMPTREESCQYLLGCLQVPAFSLVGAIQAVDKEAETAPAAQE